MICLAVYRNDVLVCNAGIADASLLSAIIASGLCDDDPATFHVAGMQDLAMERSAHVYWAHETAPSVGDRLRLSLIQSDAPSHPVEIVPTDSPEHLEEQREFEEFAKTYSGPEPLQEVRWPALEWALRLKDQPAVTARLMNEDEHIMCSLTWDKWRPDRCRILVRSFPGADEGGPEKTTEWLRDVIQVGESLEISVYA